MDLRYQGDLSYSIDIPYDMKNYKFRVIVADDEKLIAKNIALSITHANPAFDVVSVVGDGQEAYDLTGLIVIVNLENINYHIKR